jgi:hypothetical protein
VGSLLAGLSSQQDIRRLASAPARIIKISSDAHAGGKIEFDNLQGERVY